MVLSVKPLERYPKVLVAGILFIILLLFFDRGSVGGLLPKIRLHWGELTNLQAGVIQSAFIVGFMLFGPIAAHFATRYPVNFIMAFGFVFWAVSALGCGVIAIVSHSKQQFWGYYCFVAARTLLGVGEAGFISLCYSVIDDLAPDNLRSVYHSIVLAGMPLGVASGFTVSGLIVKYVDWYWLYIAEGVVGLIVTLVLFLTPYDAARQYAIEQKKRTEASGLESQSVTKSEGTSPVETPSSPSAQDGLLDPAVNTPYTPNSASPSTPTTDQPQIVSVEPEKSHWISFRYVLELLRSPTYVFSVLGSTQHNAVLGALTLWAPTWIAHRLDGVSTISDSTKLFVADIGFSVMIVIASILGTAIGGVCIDIVRRRSLINSPEMEVLRANIAITLFILIATGPGLLVFLWKSMHIVAVFIVLGSSLVLLFCVLTPINITLLSSCRPEQRNFAISLQVLAIHVLGDFPSPSLLGWIADVSKSLDIAMASIWGLLILAIVLYIIAVVFSYRKYKSSRYEKVQEAHNATLDTVENYTEDNSTLDQTVLSDTVSDVQSS